MSTPTRQHEHPLLGRELIRRYRTPVLALCLLKDAIDSGRMDPYLVPTRSRLQRMWPPDGSRGGGYTRRTSRRDADSALRTADRRTAPQRNVTTTRRSRP